MRLENILEILSVSSLAGIARAFLMPRDTRKKTVIAFAGSVFLGTLAGVLAYRMFPETIWTHSLAASICALGSEHAIRFVLRFFDSSNIKINKDL
jgi:hypothetical protein